MKIGDRILIGLSKSEGYLEAVRYCWNQEYCIIPCDPKSTLKNFIRNDSDPHYILENGEISGKLPAGEPTSAAFIIYSSGTTSLPKGIVLSREAIQTNALAMMKFHGIEKGSIHATAMNLYHCNALFMSIIGTHLVGAKLVTPEKWDAREFFELIDREKAETANICPAQVIDILNADLPWPKSLKYLFSASAPLNKATITAFAEKYGLCRLFQGYGLTETTNFSHAFLTTDENEYREKFLEPRTATVGPPVEGCHTEIRNGQVYLSSPSLFTGYFGKPLRTEGPIASGDLGFLDSDGFLTLTGRSKEVIIDGGKKHSPNELESDYSPYLTSGDFSVFAVKDPRMTGGIGIQFSDRDDFNSIQNLTPQPMTVINKPVLRNGTRKPLRSLMGSPLTCMNLGKDYGFRLIASILPLAKAIEGREVTNEQTQYLVDAAKIYSSSTTDARPFEAVTKVVDCILQHLDDFWAGTMGGEEVFRKSGGWTDLNCMAPMQHYADLTNSILSDNGLLEGDVLEFGAGVGNLSNLIHEKVGGQYVRTDLKLRCKGLGDTELSWDFNTPLSGYGKFDTIVGVNAFHCTTTGVKALLNFSELLKPGGTLVLGEGHDSIENPWPLNILFGFLKGWYDVGGFFDRQGIITLLHSTGFKDVGYTTMRSSRWDLGGVVWATID